MIENSDYFYLTVFAFIIFSLAITSKGLAKKGLIHKEISGKLVFSITAFLSGYASYVFYDYNLLAIVILIIMLIAIIMGLVASSAEIKKISLGIFYFSSAFFITLVLLGKDHKEIILLSYLILSLSGFLSTITGTFISKNYFHLTSDRKSLIGLLTFFTVTILVLVIFPRELNFSIDEKITFVSLVTLSIFLTMFEAISSKGFDNFIIPIAASLLLVIFETNSDIQFQFAVGILFSAIVALLSYRAEFLTANGSVATFLLAGLLFGLGGLQWSLPILTFFILSSILSKVRKNINEKVELHFEKSGTRDYMQVIANGGIGGILVLLNQFVSSDLIYLIYISSLAAVCADTWATEIGTLKQRTTYNILNLKPIEQGVSGGISVYGTIGAILGAFVIALSGIFWIEFSIINYILLIVFAGVAGSMFDSILGASIQAKNKCGICKEVTEKKHHCGEPTVHYKGINWLNNDMVNLLAGLSGGLLILVLVW